MSATIRRTDRPHHHRSTGLATGVAFAGVLAACTQQPPAARQPTPTATSSPAPTATVPDLDSLLPRPTAQLRTALAIAARFAAAQATHRYDEPPGTYLARLHPLTTPRLYADLARSAAGPGTLAQRTRDHTTAVATAAPHKIRSITANSMITIVTVRQNLTSNHGLQQHTDELAITVISDGSTWRAGDLQPASVGDTGDTSNDDTP